MLTYNQRYKPRTTREYTKSDLTVYDSADNTALRGLKVYGKSEIVDGTIKSAGEGYAVVDLGTLTWGKAETVPNTYWFRASLNIKHSSSSDQTGNALCPIYKTIPTSSAYSGVNGISVHNSANQIQIFDISKQNMTAQEFTNSLNGVLLCYQLADPTQGNAIAVKTDDGSGINGTMATFTTGTPLYGVSDTARDVMQWDGSAGEVVKNCNKVRFVDLTWGTSSIQNIFYTIVNDTKDPEEGGSTAICNKYTQSYTRVEYMADKSFVFNNSTQTSTKGILYIKDTDYTTVSDFVAALGDAELVYELATPVVEPLTQAENESIASLRTFDGTTHFTNNASTEMVINYTIKVPTIS